MGDHWPEIAQVATLTAEIARLRDAFSKSHDEIQQALGKALGYPWFKDDQKNFPGATETNGVCVGEHVAESIAEEAAKYIATLRAQLAEQAVEHEIQNAEACAVIEAVNHQRDEFAEEAEALFSRCRTLEEGLERAIGQLEGCAFNHYREDYVEFGPPAWLNDLRALLVPHAERGTP